MVKNLLDGTFVELNEMTGRVIGAAIEVHKVLGPGLLESIYEECLSYELEARKIPHERQKEIPIDYKGVKLGCGYRIDLLVEEKIILEIKSCESILPIHEAQLLTYLKMKQCKLGFILNWNVPRMKDGIKRMVNNL